MNRKLHSTEYMELKRIIELEIASKQIRLNDLKGGTSPFQHYIEEHVPMLEDLKGFYQKSDGKTKKRILGCIFSEKLHFENGKVATPRYTLPIEVLMDLNKVFEGNKKEKEVIPNLLPSVAPLFDERCNYNRMIELVAIRKLRG